MQPMQVSRGDDDNTTPVQLRVGWQHALSASRGRMSSLCIEPQEAGTVSMHDVCTSNNYSRAQVPLALAYSWLLARLCSFACLLATSSDIAQQHSTVTETAGAFM